MSHVSHVSGARGKTKGDPDLGRRVAKLPCPGLKSAAHTGPTTRCPSEIGISLVSSEEDWELNSRLRRYLFLLGYMNIEGFQSIGGSPVQLSQGDIKFGQSTYLTTLGFSELILTGQHKETGCGAHLESTLFAL